jgi:thioredoxin reductase (NADPH)
MVEKNKIVVDEDMKTNIPGLFAAGDCIGGMYQVYKAVSDGSIAGTRVAAFIRGL